MYEVIKIDLGTGGIAPCTRCSAVSREPFHMDAILRCLVEGDSTESTTDSLGSSNANVIFGGFEPFRHPNLVQILDFAATKPLNSVTRIGLQTDGGALSVPSNAFGSINSDVTFFEIVLRGGDELSHDTLTGDKGSFGLAIKGISGVSAAARELSKPIFVAGVAALCGHNNHLLPAIISTFVNAGVDAIRVECQGGTEPDPALVKQSYEIATTSGVLLFGDGCSRTESAELYHVEDMGCSS